MYKNNTNTNSTTIVNRTPGTLPNGSNWGAGKTLADYVKESAAWSQNSSLTSNHLQQQQYHHLNHQSQHNTTTSMPWAAAVKAPPDMSASNLANQNSFDYNNSTIGSWNSPETSSSNRSGWNADGSSKNEGAFDDGTAIWGNPTQKKTGVDWAEKESLLNPPQAQTNNHSDKPSRAQRAEPVISSINGTEAWGAPMRNSPVLNNISQQQLAKNDISGNTFGSLTSLPANESQLSWSESTSSSRNIHQTAASSTNENSSPPISDSVWNNLGTASNKQKSPSDWLASSNSRIGNNLSGSRTNNNTRLDGLNKQLGSSSLFDSAPSKNSASLASSNSSTLGLGLGAGHGLGGLIGGWADSSSRNINHTAALLRSENSSPPSSDSVWNSLGSSSNKQKSPPDWLVPSNSIVGNVAGLRTSNSSRIDELNKQLESTNLFDSVPSKNVDSLTSNNGSNLGLGLGLGGSHGLDGLVRANSINDLKQQISANFSNDLLDSPNRQSGSNQQSHHQQMDSSAAMAAAYSSAAPSRDLLKQMVHQIQLAVQAGHLNAHILNQPMSAPTLQLVYQLLKQIKTLHQLQEIQQRSGAKSNDMGSPTNMDIQINRIRQNISLLQKAITQQQSQITKNENIGDMNLKQQQQQQAAAAAAAAANNFSYASISKLSTNMKVPSNQTLNNILGNSNIDSFRGSSLVDSLSNSNSLSFLKSSSSEASNIQTQRSNTALYDWSDLGQTASPSSLQFGGDPANQMGKQQAAPSVSSANNPGATRPAPPPGLMNNNFRPIIANSRVNNSTNQFDIHGIPMNQFWNDYE